MLDCVSLIAVTASRGAGAADKGPPSGRGGLRGPLHNLGRVPLRVCQASQAPAWRYGGGRRPASRLPSPAKVERTPAPVTSEAAGSALRRSRKCEADLILASRLTLLTIRSLSASSKANVTANCGVALGSRTQLSIPLH